MPQQLTRFSKPPQTNYKWVPKTKKPSKPIRQKAKQSNTSAKTTITHRWVPKQTVSQQWDGCGVTKIWIPKILVASTNLTSIPKPQLGQGTSTSQPILTQSQITHKWVRKTVPRQLSHEPTKISDYLVEDSRPRISIKQRAKQLELLLYHRHLVL